jgi:hypothetical protein
MENYVLIPDRRVGIDGTITTPEMAPWSDPTYRPVCLGNLFLWWIKHYVHVMRRLHSSNSNTLYRWHTATAFLMQSSFNGRFIGVWWERFDNKKKDGDLKEIRCRICIQQDATLHSLFYLETALHVSGGTITHHQGRRQLSTSSGICHTVIAICRYRGRVGTGLSVLWVAYA